MKLENLNDQLMVMAAHRYCLGRQSYIVSSCIEFIRATWDQMERNTKLVLLRDTAEALMGGHAGSQFDVREWNRLLEWGWYTLDNTGHVWILNALAYKQKPFPLENQ